MCEYQGLTGKDQAGHGVLFCRFVVPSDCVVPHASAPVHVAVLVRSFGLCGLVVLAATLAVLAPVPLFLGPSCALVFSWALARVAAVPCVQPFHNVRYADTRIIHFHSLVKLRCACGRLAAMCTVYRSRR